MSLEKSIDKFPFRFGVFLKISTKMSLSANMILEKKNTLIFIFIQKISPKNMQDLTFFLKEVDFHIKRFNKENNKKNFTSKFLNSNFILESKQNFQTHQLKNIIFFLNKHAQVHGIFFQNQILNLERLTKFGNQSLFVLWKQINNFLL